MTSTSKQIDRDDVFFYLLLPNLRSFLACHKSVHLKESHYCSTRAKDALVRRQNEISISFAFLFHNFKMIRSWSGLGFLSRLAMLSLVSSWTLIPRTAYQTLLSVQTHDSTMSAEREVKQDNPRAHWWKPTSTRSPYRGLDRR